MKRHFISFFTILFLISDAAEAQVIYVAPGPGPVHRYRKVRVRKATVYRQPFTKFEPSVNISVGYGFPNVDKEALVNFTGLRRGNASQTGPLTGAIDYKFSRNTSIGVLVTHGKVNVPYYDYYTGVKSLEGSLDNWAFMLNIVRYIPVPGSVVTPYIRTAIGVNNWKQDYISTSGNKIDYISTPSDFAYQAGIGANINLSKNAGVFLEAGYGKYILHGGLSFKF